MFRRRCIIRLLTCAWTLIAFAPAAFARSSSIAGQLPAAATAQNSDHTLAQPISRFFVHFRGFLDRRGSR